MNDAVLITRGEGEICPVRGAHPRGLNCWLLAGDRDEAVLLDDAGAQVESSATTSSTPAEDGSRAVAVELRDEQGRVLRWVQQLRLIRQKC